MAHLVWTPPRPGDALLTGIAPALAAGLALAVLATVVVSRRMVQAARDLEAAQATNRARSAFLANVSHELRTPVNGILGMGELIRAMRPEPKVARMMAVLLASARSQLELIEDLLDIARIDSGDTRLTSAPFDPVRTAREVCELLAPQAAEKGIDLHIEAPRATEARALGDAGRFRQILTNLVANAIKFTDDGAVTVQLHAAEGAGRFRVALCVSDTGSGIPPDEHEQIFERFVQADATPAPRATGNGLGLSIVKSLVELVGGTLWLESAPGRGTAFHVDIAFPRVSDASAAWPPAGTEQAFMAAE